MTEQEMRQWRKERPVYSGVLKYFPDALLEVAHCSWVGNEQHNPGTPLHWDRSKSQDEADACTRHLMESGTVDSDGVRHSAKAAWRALALLQKEIEAEQARDEDLDYAPYERQCLALLHHGNGYCCTRTKGHTGQHIAHDMAGDVCARWRQS